MTYFTIILTLACFWKPTYYLFMIYCKKQDSFKGDLKDWWSTLYHLVSPKVS